MRLLRVFIAVWIASVATADAAVKFAASCAPTDVQAAINSAAGGDTVVIPAGSCTWTSGVSISGKGIILQGQSMAGVIITNNVTVGEAFFVKEDATIHSQIAQMTIIGNSVAPAIVVDAHDTPADLNGKSVFLHDLAFSDSTAIRLNANRGLIYSITANNHKGTQEVIQCKPEQLQTSWTTRSTMGTADTTGESNVYVEDSTFTLALHQAIDWDDNCRIVLRHNVFDNSSITSHGPDTSNFGSRHFEIYDNAFIFTNQGDCDGSRTANLAYFIFIRGATGVITGNTGLVNMVSCAWGSKPAVNMTVMNLQRVSGPNGCWGQNSSGGAKYPAPRQVGHGNVTGTGHDGTGRTNDIWTYVGDVEPLYIWSPNVTPAISDYNPGAPDSCTGAPTGYDVSTNYLVAGRDYFMDGTAKPGYTKFTYPHPLRSVATAPAPPLNLRVVGP